MLELQLGLGVKALSLIVPIFQNCLKRLICRLCNESLERCRCHVSSCFINYAQAIGLLQGKAFASPLCKSRLNLASSFVHILAFGDFFNLLLTLSRLSIERGL